MLKNHCLVAALLGILAITSPAAAGKKAVLKFTCTNVPDAVQAKEEKAAKSDLVKHGYALNDIVVRMSVSEDDEGGTPIFLLTINGHDRDGDNSTDDYDVDLNLDRDGNGTVDKDGTENDRQDAKDLDADIEALFNEVLR